jgi:tetratricopeptide (TPR) repeat protein
MKGVWKSLGAVCVLAIAIYAYTAQLGKLESLMSNPADSPYNLLVQGFRDGHLCLKKEIPPGFTQLADPYDPSANRPYRSVPYRLSDLSYYKSKLYLYWGITPAIMLFWPYVVLTGHYLADRQAVTIFCAIGILAGLGLLRALWRRYFAEVSVGVVVACALGLGLATGVPVLLPRSDVYAVAIICGYMLTMLALGAIWRALHETERKGRWLVVASVAYGLAVGARPSLLFGGVILLVPVIQTWREQRSIGMLLLAATGPILLIGLGLMLYNDLRFDSPFELGQHYQLGGQRQLTWPFFSGRYLWFNFRVYFLEPAHWRTPFPYVHEITVPPLPTGQINVQEPFGVLTNVPLIWLALAAPLAWRSRSGMAVSPLRWFLVTVALLFGTSALALEPYCSTAFRYEVDFLPALTLLAVVGILGLERVLADRPAWRRAARWGWGLLLGFSVAFNVLLSLENYAYAGCALGTTLAEGGRLPEAIQIFEEALRTKADFAEGHDKFGTTLVQAGRITEAIEQYEEALRIRPEYAEVHYNLGNTLLRVGKIEEAIGHYQQAVRINPDYAEAQNNLGGASFQLRRDAEAVEHYEQALRIKPEYAEAHFNLGLALARLGRVQEAMAHWEQAVRINPDYAEPHYALGIALEQMGRTKEAIAHYEQALRIKPGYTEARNALTRLQFGL